MAISMKRTTLIVLQLCSIATMNMSMTAVQAASTMTASEMAEIFLQYDVPEDDSPDCQPEVIDDSLCPRDDDKLSCGPIEGIVKYCMDLLGGEIAAKYSGGNGIEMRDNVVEVSTVLYDDMMIWYDMI